MCRNVRANVKVAFLAEIYFLPAREAATRKPLAPKGSAAFWL
jgi:hypothetical protein